MALVEEGGADVNLRGGERGDTPLMLSVSVVPDTIYSTFQDGWNRAIGRYFKITLTIIKSYCLGHIDNRISGLCYFSINRPYPGLFPHFSLFQPA